MFDSPLQKRLEAAHPLVFTLFAALAAFCSYACMYAFRKPFTAAEFADGPVLFGLGYKSVLVITQVAGYALSKFLGIKFVSEAKSDRRPLTILSLIGISQLAWLGFGLAPPSYGFVFLFFNGLPLGMIWGLVFSYVEGRKFTEVIGLALCASFVFSSGFVKDIGRMLMRAGLSEYWMPFMTGLVFLAPLLISVWLLSQLPPPSAADEAARTKRQPMNGAERWAFFRKFALGLVLLVTVYTVLTTYRDFRDNFMQDIWMEIVEAENPGLDAAALVAAKDAVNFSATETPVSIGVLLLLMLLVLVKDNRMALMINLLAVLAGVLMAGISTWGFHQGWLSGFTWMMLTGFGTYLAYIPFNSILFDRLIAAFRYVSNVGFLIYLADAFGYLGSVSALIFKDFGAQSMSWIEFFSAISYALAAIGGLGTVMAMGYFWLRHQRRQAELAAVS